MKNAFAKSIIEGLFLVVAVAVSSASAQSGTWLGNANWWSDPASWSGGVTADGADNTANFTGVNITGDINKPLGSTSPAQNRTIGHIIFTDTTPSHNLTLSANTLTLDVTSGSPSIDVTQSDRTLTISSAIAGNEGLTKSGLGTLTLSGNSTYTGITTVNNGTLTLGHANALGGSAAGSETTMNGNGSSDGTVLNLGSTGLTLSESFNLKGTTNGRATIVNNSAAAHVLNGNIDVTSGTSHAQIKSDSTGSITINGDITGTMINGALLLLRGTSTSNNNRILGNVNISGDLTKTDGGIWTIGAASKTYAWGNTTVSVATLRMGVANVLPSATVVTLGQSDANPATLDLNGFSQAVAGIQLAASPGTGTRTITSSTAATLTVGDGNTYSYGGVLTGSLALTKTGSGTLTLSGTNSFTGTTAISAGTLRLQGASPLNTGRTYTINGGSVMNLNGGATFNTSVAGSSTINGTGTLSLSGGTYSRGAAGGGTLTLSLGAGGLIDIQSGATVSTWYSPVVSFTGNQATLNVAGTINGNSALTIDADALTGAGTINNTGTTALNIGVNNGSGTFSGTITNAAGVVALTKTGTGTQTLSGNNSYSGNTTLGGGTLKITGAGRLYSAAYNGTAVVTVQSGGVLELDTWDYGASRSLGQLAKEAARIVISNGTIRINGTTEYGRGLTVLAGGASFEAAVGANWTHGGADYIANVYTGNPSLTFTGAGTGTFAKVFSGSGALTKSGAGTWTLTTNNTYTGATTVNAGTLRLGANNVIPNASNISIGTATLDADTRTDTVGTLDVTGTAVINLGSGAALAFADSKAVDWTGGTLNITGTLGATSLRFGDSADDLTSGQLAKISVNGSGLGIYILDANGYLVVGPPQAVTLDPADNAINVAETANLVVTFNQNVLKGTGNFEIKKTSDNSVLETIDVTSGLVTVSGAVATINSSADLPSGIECYVLIEAGTFTNANGSFAGITDPTTWSFKTAGAPPTLTSIVDNKSGGPIATNTLVTYTVTFSEDMDDSTVSDTDFDNAGTAAVTIGAVTETSANSGIFTVEVTPTSGGTLRLQINAGAELKNVFGIDLVTTPALLDDTTITVDAAAPSPDPMTFASPPAALTATSISMTATTATDPSGVEYFFACTGGGGPDSGWQSSAVFTPTGLNRGTIYSYTVRARDAVHNETAPSAAASATTLAGAMTLYSSGNKSWDTTSVNWGTGSGGPYNNAIWNSGDSAIFEGTAGTVTLGAAITVSNLTINTAGYTITGNTLNFASGSTITVPNPPNNTPPGATIESNITGAPAANLTPMDGDEPFTFKPAANGSMVLGNVTGDGAGNGSNRIYFQGGAGSTGSVGTVSGPKTFWSGSGTWTLTGTANGYAHEITSGTLIISTGTLRANNRNTLLSGGTLHYNNPGAVQDPSATSGANQDFQLNGGSLDNTSGAAITTSTYNPNMYWSSNCTFIGSQGTNSDLFLGNGGVILAATRQVTVQNTATTLAVGGVIDGVGFGLTKAGAGTLELRGINTYSGATTINAGTLLIKSPGSLSASSAVAVNGGSLGGNGTIGGTVTVGAAGSIAPSAPGSSSVGTLTIGGGLNVSAMANGGTGKLKFDLDAPLPATGSDKIAVIGTLTIGAGVLGLSDFDFTKLAGFTYGKYTLISSSTAISGALNASDLVGEVDGKKFTLQINGNALELDVAPIGGQPSVFRFW